MLGKIENKHPFTGPATAELTGLPHGVTCPPQTLTQDQKEITFPLTLAADATIGKHNAIFCRISVPENSTTIIHRTALNSTLRIDALSPAPVAKAAPEKPADPQVKTESTKPLSRLEQLRQRAK